MVKAPRFHIRHLMIAVAAAAIFFGACVFDDRCNSCTPLSLVLFWSYVCGALSIWGARVARLAGTHRDVGGVIAGTAWGDLGLVEPAANFHARPAP